MHFLSTIMNISEILNLQIAKNKPNLSNLFIISAMRLIRFEIIFWKFLWWKPETAVSFFLQYLQCFLFYRQVVFFCRVQGAVNLIIFFCFIPESRTVFSIASVIWLQAVVNWLRFLNLFSH